MRDDENVLEMPSAPYGVLPASDSPFWNVPPKWPVKAPPCVQCEHMRRRAIASVRYGYCARHVQKSDVTGKISNFLDLDREYRCQGRDFEPRKSFLQRLFGW